MQDKVRNGVAEDRVTSAIESQTSKIPSSGYLAAAFGAIAASAILKVVGKDDWALFVGQWPAAFMLMGVYNKIVKQHGSDAFSKAASPAVTASSKNAIRANMPPVGGENLATQKTSQRRQETWH